MTCQLHSTPRPAVCNECAREKPPAPKGRLVLLPSDKSKYQIVKLDNYVTIIRQGDSQS